MKSENKTNYFFERKYLIKGLENITDFILSGTGCSSRWGEVPLPDSLRQYYEEKAKREDEE